MGYPVVTDFCVGHRFVCAAQIMFGTDVRSLLSPDITSTFLLRTQNRDSCRRGPYSIDPKGHNDTFQLVIRYCVQIYVFIDICIDHYAEVS